MKLSDMFALCLLSSLLLMTAIEAAGEIKQACPPKTEIDKNCKCYASVRTMICGDLTSAFELNSTYHIVSLQISNTQNLGRLIEHSGNGVLKVDNLIISQEEDSPAVAPTLDHLEKVLKISTKSIKIVSKKNLTDQVMDVTYLSSKLTSLSINSVASLKGFKFENFKNLEELQLTDVHFTKPIENVELYQSSLTHVEITNTENLKGTFLFSPKACTKDDKIHIDLQDTKGLTDFDFTELFENADCHYHIDLSDTGMNAKFLTSQAVFLAKQEAGRFYLILSGVSKLECDCNVYTLYRKPKFADYIHSVHCEKQKKYLDQISWQEAECSKDPYAK